MSKEKFTGLGESEDMVRVPPSVIKNVLCNSRQAVSPLWSQSIRGVG